MKPSRRPRPPIDSNPSPPGISSAPGERQGKDEADDVMVDFETDLLDDEDDSRWEVFLADDDERDPLPESGDFEGSLERGARSMEFD